MKRLALLLVVMLFLALTVTADDGQIPIGGKTTCTENCPTSLATPSTPDDKEISIIGSTIILDVLRSILVM